MYNILEAAALAREGKTIENKNMVSRLVWSSEYDILVYKNSGTPFQTSISNSLLDNRDWSVVKEKHRFGWAIEQLNVKRMVRRDSWSKEKTIECVNGNFYDQDGNIYRLNTRDLTAEDWTDL